MVKKEVKPSKLEHLACIRPAPVLLQDAQSQDLSVCVATEPNSASASPGPFWKTEWALRGI